VQLKKRLQSAVQSSERTLGSKARHYGENTDLHWRRHKALVDHNGEWLHMDIPGEVSQPIIESIDMSWGDDFDTIASSADQLKEQFVEQVGFFVHAFAMRLAEWPALKDHGLALGTATKNNLAMLLNEEVSEFRQFVRKTRGGCAEAVQEKVQVKVASSLSPAKYFSGPGSFHLRKQSVTCNLPRMELEATVKSPKEKLEKVLEELARVTRSLTTKSCQSISECYSDLWDRQHKRSEQERISKAALRRVVQAELSRFGEAVSCARQAIPTGTLKL